MVGYYILLKFAPITKIFIKRSKKDQYDVLLTGNFYSDNWIYAQLKPLTLSEKILRIRMVAETTVPNLPKVEPVYPSKNLARIVGSDIARLLTFLWLGLSTRPDIVGGFHLLVNGLLAILLGKMLGGRSVYICGGGPREVIGGGYACENRIFGKLKNPDKIIEKQLLNAVSHADIVVTRGRQAIDYFISNGVKSDCYVVPAGIDGSLFSPIETEIAYDLAVVGRLTEVKRIDTYLHAIAKVRDTRPDIKAAVIGDGPLLYDLNELADRLDLKHNVSFLGYREDVDKLLQKTRIFVLTSDSEGLSQAMIQAMMCGLPAIVSDVGDLRELVEDGVNGFLINNRTPEAFADAIQKMLELPEEDMQKMKYLSRKAAMRCDLISVSETWNTIFK